MEGRRSRSKPSGSAEVSPPQPRPAASRPAVAQADTAQQDADDGRSVPMISGENKRKRAPRGPPGRNLKAKTEAEAEDEAAKLDAVASTERDDGPTACGGGGFKEENGNGIENGEAGAAAADEGVNAKEPVEKRRGSSRPRIRPSKFRESFPATSSAKVKGELRSNDEGGSSLEIVLPINAIISPLARPRDNPREGPDTTFPTSPRKKEAKGKSAVSAAAKEKEPSTSSPAAPPSPDRPGLKAILLVLKRVMKMKEADPFNKPVDPVELGIPDYFQVVKRPMDLGTIRDRLESGDAYNAVEDVLEDVALVWSNCRTYNDEGDPVVEFLQSVESTFNKLCAAAGLPARVAQTAEGERAAKSEPPKGEAQREATEEPPKASKKKKKKAKVSHPDAVGGSLKTKIKRSAPVEQVMAESRARERSLNSEGDPDRDVKNAVEISGPADDPLEALHRGRGPGSQEDGGYDLASPQGPLETKPQTVGAAATAPEKHHRKGANLQLTNLPNKTKRPNGHSTLSHRQGCLCVVCFGRRKREAKLRKSSGGANAGLSKPKKTVKTPAADDAAVRSTLGDSDADEEFPFADGAEDALYQYASPDAAQGYYPASYQLPLRKLAPSVVEMSRLLLGSRPGSIWNRPRSLGYVAGPAAAHKVGLAEALASLLHTQ